MALPEAEERDHWGRPSFRVRGRIFATLWPDDERGVVKVSRDEMAALAESDPATYIVRPWGASSWLEVSLTRADPGEVSELVVEAWRSVAPRRLVAAHERRHQRGAAETT